MVENDWAFARLPDEPDAGGFGDTLNAFWTLPEHRLAARALELPFTGLHDIAASVRRLAAGEALGELDAWVGAAENSRALCDQDPAAGAIAALQATAAWEGKLGDALHVHSARTRPHAGWLTFPRILAENLLAADALWGARAAVQSAIYALDLYRYGADDPGVSDGVAAYIGLLERIDARRAEHARALAWDLREGLRRDAPSMRPRVASLLWTLGDVPHAHVVARTEDDVSLRLLGSVASQSMRRGPADPLLQHVWMTFDAASPLDLRRHPVAVTRILAPGRTMLHRVDEHVATVYAVSGGSAAAAPSAAYARTLVAWFAGSLDTDQRSLMVQAFQTLTALAPTLEPPVGTRLESLMSLVVGPEDEARWQRTRDKTRQTTARGAMERSNDAYDRSSDVPFYYVAAAASASADPGLDEIERYRCANLSPWLLLVRPPSPTGVASALFEREKALLDELVGVRLMCHLAELPKVYTAPGFELTTDALHTLGIVAEDGIAQPWISPELFDRDRARARVHELQDELGSLFQEIAARAPDYARARTAPCADLDRFAAALAPRRTLRAP